MVDARVALYRHFDADGRLLYVGVTCNPLGRLSYHQTLARWFERIAFSRMEWFDSRAEAEAAESRAIAAEHPEFNVQVARRAPRGRLGKRKAPPTAFGRWLRDNGVLAKDMAARLDISGAHICRIMHAKQPPSLALAAKIEALTDGAVPASSWTAPETIAAE